MSDQRPKQRRVVCAANKIGGRVILGVRHWDEIMRQHFDDLGLRPSHCHVTQGFVDQHGVFMTREEACIVATEAGQLLQKTHPLDQLFSEDLY